MQAHEPELMRDELVSAFCVINVDYARPTRIATSILKVV